MEQPPRFVAQGESDKVCRLQKSLYGLKQFSQALVRFGMQKSTYDHSIFYRRSDNGIVLLVVAVEQIPCYLKVSPRRGILYKDHGHTRVECFSDANWAGSRENRRSTYGYCVFVGGNLVSWKSKKQNVVSRSSVESEYKVMAQSVCEIVWIHQLLSEIGFSITVPTKLWCDNQAALHIASNPVFHERNKHIEVDCYFIREKIQDGLVSTGYVKIKEQLGDILTKVVNGARISYLCNKLDMMDIFAPA
ncbi:hypothetical protein IC582_028853 [Cucumis melo]